jgi:hypothetical protein
MHRRCVGEIRTVLLIIRTLRCREPYRENLHVISNKINIDGIIMHARRDLLQTPDPNRVNFARYARE